MNVLKLVAIIILIFPIFACNEENPYSSQYRSGRAINNGDLTNSNSSRASSESANVENQSDGSEISVEDAELIEEVIISDEVDINEASKTTVQLICQEPELFQNFALEIGVFCQNGQPTNQFINALNSPYQGSGTPQVPLIVSEDNNRISQFVLVFAMEVPNDIASVRSRIPAVNSQTITAGNATMRQTELETLVPSGRLVGGADVRMDVTVSVFLGITITDNMVQRRENHSMDPNSTLFASIGYLKPNDPLNSPESVSNVVGFIIADGEKTMLINVLHQQVANQGFHTQARNSALAMARQNVVQMYNLLSN